MEQIALLLQVRRIRLHLLRGNVFVHSKTSLPRLTGYDITIESNTNSNAAQPYEFGSVDTL